MTRIELLILIVVVLLCALLATGSQPSTAPAIGLPAVYGAPIP